MNGCELFETVVLPALPERGTPEPDDLCAWRARRHRAACAGCTARAARFEAALMALNLAADVPVLEGMRWPRVESAAAAPAAQPGRESPRAKAARVEAAGARDPAPDGLDWRPFARAAVVGVALATMILGFEYVRLESDGFAFLQHISSPLDEVRLVYLDEVRLVYLDEGPLRMMFLIGFAICAAVVNLFLSRLFCQNGQCLA